MVFRALRGSLAEDPETVQEFLCSLSEGVRPLAKEDYLVIRDMKHSELITNAVSLFPRLAFYFLKNIWRLS